MILLEGGNVIKGASPIAKDDFPTAVKNLEKILPKGLNLYPIGSAGKKEISSDIDALIDARELLKVFPAKELKLSRKALEDFFKDKGLESARTGVSVHVGIPTGKGNEIVQVDLMAVENAKAAQPLHTHDYTDPTMKGGTLHAMWADLANMSSIPGHERLMMSPYKGLVDRETKELVTSDKDKIAKIIIGPAAKADDMGNPTKMLKALAKYPDKYKMIQDKYFSQQGVAEGDVIKFPKSKIDNSPLGIVAKALGHTIDTQQEETYGYGVEIKRIPAGYGVFHDNKLNSVHDDPEIAHEQALDLVEIIKDEQGLAERLNEAADVGRKYQHLEDLVLSHGSHGGLHAVERLRDMATQGGSIELKWDGMPVVYWGRDEKGNFMMIPKNAWAYIKRGESKTKSGASTVTRTPQDVAKFILGTGSGDPKERTKFAKQFAMLWPYFEKISPKSGFIEGGLLFYPGTKPDGNTAMPVLNKETKTYDFQPNITQFHVPADSDLGKKIAKAKVGVAATGYFPSLGSGDEQRLPDAQKLSTPDVLVQGTTFVQEPVKLDTKMLDNIANYIESNASKIDKFLEPKPGLSKPAQELYSYLNKHLRKEGLLRDFPAWAKANLSPKKAQTLLADQEGLVATLGAIESLTKQKNSMVRQLSQSTHGGIKQTKPEGYAQAHPGRKFKYDIPGQFIKAVDQDTWSPKESILRENVDKKAVLGWGRGMGHTGHDTLVQAVIHQAEKTGSDPYFIVSRSFGKDDPIPPEMKLDLYKKKFPRYKNIFSLPSSDKPTLNDVLQDLANKGYKDVALVVGADQKEAFGYLLKPAKSTGVEPYKSFGLNSLSVLSRQDTKAPGSDPESKDYHEGPRATPMRQVLMDPSKSEQEQFEVWRQSMSKQLSDKEVLDMMRLAKTNLKKFNQPKTKKVKPKLDTPKGRKLKEFVDNVKPLLEYATYEQKTQIIKLLEKAKEEISKKSYDFDKDYVDPELYTDLNWIKQHYPMAKTKEEAFVKFVQRSLKHSKEDTDKHQKEIEKITKKIEALEKAVAKLLKKEKSLVENFITEK